ncbi:male accessory gland serine protease inhibitor-like [Teleopsis dalmanni]|uniref:male accessory gland serine protease inhibitor-like n=1 Tax=Teleopsis dalmanni TaxID=139649 RepID=UPI0018CE7426|nr:male accessory gland serine protease inhibitor-like [Teleopsis dalmanni]
MKLFLYLLSVVFLINAVLGLKNAAICGLQHSKNGDGKIACLGYRQSWSYNSAANECVQFIYGGCQGNDNRFDSKEACEDTCKE